MTTESAFAFRDYDSLVATIADWLARPDDPEILAVIPTFIWLAECEIQQTVKFRLRDVIATGTSVADQEYIDLPADYVEGDFFKWDNTSLPPIDVSSWQNVVRLQKTGGSSHTRRGVVHGARLYIGPATGAEPWTLFYRGGVTHLGKRGNATEAQSNIILEEYPGTIFYGALRHSAPYLGAGERAAEWQTLYNAALSLAVTQEWNARASHGPLMMKPDTAVL